MADIFNYFNNFNYYGNPLIWGLIIVFSVLYGLVWRRQQILINLLALYIAILGTSFFSVFIVRVQQLSAWPTKYITLLCFIFFWLLGLAVLGFSHLIRKTDGYRSFIWHWVQAVFNAVIHSGLVFSFILNSSANYWQNYFSGWQLKLLLGPLAQAVWFILSLVSVLIMRVRKRRPGRPSL